MADDHWIYGAPPSIPSSNPFFNTNPPIILDDNYINAVRDLISQPSPTVITDVFGDTQTFDPTTNTWKPADPSVAYDRFEQLNPPYTPPAVNWPSVSSFFGNIGAYIVIAVVAIILIKR
jgi:hypothetical protein